jgi:serine/threonine-protein kinase
MLSVPEKIWSSDWVIGLALGIILGLVAFLGLLQPLEQIVSDLVIRQIHRQPRESIAVIAIDEKSLTQLGDWPWWRTTYAVLVDLIAPRSKVIGITLDFSKVQQDSKAMASDGLMTDSTNYWITEEFQEFNKLMAGLGKVRGRSAAEKDILKQLLEYYRTSTLFAKLPEELSNFLKKIKGVESSFNRDDQLASSFKQAGNVVLGIQMDLLDHASPSLAPGLPDYVLKHRLKNISTPLGRPSLFPLPGVNAIPPLVNYSNSVSGLAPVPKSEDLDSSHVPLVIKYDDAYFATLPLLLVAKKLHLDNNDIEVKLGKGIRLGERWISTDAYLRMQPFYYHDTKPPAIEVDSFVDVLMGRVPVQKYQDKIVLLGVTASPYSVLQATPIGEMPAVLGLAHQVTSLLNQDFFVQPKWVFGGQVGIFILVMAYLCFWLPRCQRRRLAVKWSGMVFILLIVAYVVFFSQGWSVQLMPTLLLLSGGHLALLVKRGIIAYQDAFRLHPDAVESNRLLGLAFQGQGQLDMAFDKFRLCPPDDAILGLLYNLALDYELKRQYRRARAVYRYLQSQHPEFRDVEQRLEWLHHLRRPKFHSTAMMLSNYLEDEGYEKPFLGRYQIERQLGKGAMSVVYLGRDSKLDRLVAIKILALSQEFEAEELDDATARFFRAATAAGRLKQPNIIAIYDAGVEQDIAYLAMEFFKGGHLVPYTKPDNLLPIPTVLKLIIGAAEALDYASKQGVVHRDIKPANIMYNPATEQIKITDFGIACITDSKKTKTGIILGTPSYMSPEQLTGSKLDGRTDLFSLGIMFYQLCTGTLPFQADTMATLMFKIANEPHIDISMVRTDLPSGLKPIIDKALQKDVNDRYQSGSQFAQALRDCQILGDV